MVKEDLGIKIGSKEESFWQDVVDSECIEIEGLEKMMKLHCAVRLMAQDKVIHEEAKRSSDTTSDKSS